MSNQLLRAALSVALALAIAALSATAVARADDGPALVVVVEASGTRIDTSRLRARISDVLGMPAISILESSRFATIGVLAIAVTERGRRAAVQYLPTDGLRYAMMIEVRATGRQAGDGSWLVDPCVSTVRSSTERRAAQAPTLDVVDPWITSHAIPVRAGGEPGPTIDPWVGLPRAGSRVWVTDYHVAEEVEDPWAEAVTRYRVEQERRVSPRGTPR